MSTAAAASSSDVIIEDFEDGDLSEYTHDPQYYETGASVVTSPTYSGSYALKIQDTDVSMYRPDPPNDPERGDVFAFRVKSNQDCIPLCDYGVQDTANHYCARLDWKEDTLMFLRQEDDHYHTLGQNYLDFTLQDDVWYTVKIQWEESCEHKITVKGGGNSATLTCTDATWEGGAIGFTGNVSSGEIYYDYVTNQGPEGYIVESFGDGDITNYTFDGGESGASTVASPAYHGDYALEIAGTDTLMFDTNLSSAPAQSEEFRSRIQADSESLIAIVLYGVQDAENYYLARIHFSDDTIHIMRKENGSFTTVAQNYLSFDLVSNEWYEVTVNWTLTGQHAAEISGNGNTGSLSGVDETWTHGGLGFQTVQGSGEHIWFDHVTKNYGYEIEEFERGLLSDFDLIKGSSENISNSTTYYGEKALKIQDEEVGILSSDSSRKTPESGDTFSIPFIKNTDGGKFDFLYGAQNWNNNYRIRYNADSDSIQLLKKSSGSISSISSSDSVQLSTDTWHWCEVKWEGDRHVATIYGQNGVEKKARVSGTDSSWSGGKVGIHSFLTSGQTYYFDHISKAKLATSVTSTSTYPTVSDRGNYSGLSIEELAQDNNQDSFIDYDKHPSKNKYAFVTAAFGNWGIYVGEGVSSPSEVPDTIYEITPEAEKEDGFSNVRWDSTDMLRYHRSHKVSEQKVPADYSTATPKYVIHDTLRGGEI